MRTTVRLPEDLMARAKMAAARDGTTLTALIERGLRSVLDEPKPSPKERVMPRVSSVSGRQLLDITSMSALLDEIEDDLPLEKRR